MKQTFTLLALMVLATIVAFGQSTNENTLNTKQHHGSKISARIKAATQQNESSATLKSAQAAKQWLTSDVIQISNNEDVLQNLNQNLYTYDEQEKLTQTITNLWDANINNYKNGIKYVYTRNTNGYITLKTDYSWIDNNWIQTSTEEYTYDANWNITQEISSEWAVGILTGKSRQSYTYDASNRITKTENSTWDLINSVWVNTTKEESTYDIYGNETSLSESNWETNQWVYENQWRYNFTYDTNGDVTQEIESKKVGEDWVETERGFIEYNNRQPVSATYQVWDTNTTSWLNSEKYEYTYENNKETKYSYFKYENATYTEQGRSEYTYDANGNITSTTEYSWDATNKLLEKAHYHLYTFELAISITDLVLPGDLLYNDNTYANKLTKQSHSSWDGTKWVVNMEATYNYSNSNINPVNNTETTQVIIYPNPVSKELHISIKDNDEITFELFDLKGSKVINKKIDNESVVNMENVKSGIYYYHISLTESSISGKLIKK